MTKKRRIIIDFEFTWLDNSFIKDNEIISMSYFDIDKKISKVFYFSTNKKNTVTSFLKNGITEEDQKDNPLFSKNFFLNTIDIENSDIYGFGTSSDKKMLAKYDINFEYKDDIQAMLRKTKYEETIAKEWRSFESCCYIVLNEIFNQVHKWTYEVDKMYDLFQIATKLREERILKYVPYGGYAWMLIEDFVKENPERALSFAQEKDFKEAINQYLEK